MHRPDIQSMIWSLPIAGIVKTAIELQLFDTLSESPGADSDTLARAIGADARGTRILLDATAALGLVVRVDGGYTLTAESARYLVRTSPRYVGAMLSLLGTPVMWQGYEHFTEAVRAGGTVLREHAEDPEYALWDRFPEHTVSMARQGGKLLAALLAERLPTDAPLRVLDVACGTGLYGFSVAEQFPRASITSLDWEKVLVHSREHAERLALGERVRYLPGDMFTADLAGPYDLVIASHVFHHFDDEHSTTLMTRLAQATCPGGRIVIHDFVIGAAPPATDPVPHLFATTMLATTRRGDTYTKPRFDDILVAAGYTRAEECSRPGLPTRFLFAERGNR